MSQWGHLRTVSVIGWIEVNLIMSELTKTLAKAQADGVEWCEQLVEWSAGLGGNVPDTSAVEMQLDVVSVRKLGDSKDLVLGEDGPIQSVF